ncbi:hypothetical protein DK45_4653 [Bordetella bronchiseptica]|nr:hypothetical protein DK45_4653 [Bordetella bronchiseptica]
MIRTAPQGAVVAFAPHRAAIPCGRTCCYSVGRTAMGIMAAPFRHHEGARV